MIATARGGPSPDRPWRRATRKLRLRRGLRPRIRRAAVHLQRGDFRERCEQAALQARLRRRPARRRRAGRSRQPRRQRRDPGPGLGARRARQRLLAGARRPGRPLARALAAPARVPRRLARSARATRASSTSASDEETAASPTCSPTAAASRSSSPPSPPGAASPTAAEAARSRGSAAPLLRLAWRPEAPSRRACCDRLGAGVADRSSGRGGAAVGEAVERRQAAPGARERGRREEITVVSPPNGARGSCDHGQRAAVDEVTRGGERAARHRLRHALERVDQHHGVTAAGGDAPRGVDGALDRLPLGVRRGGEAEPRSSARGAGLPLADLLGSHPGEHERTSRPSARRARRPAGARLALARARGPDDRDPRTATERREPLDRPERGVVGAEREALAREGRQQVVVVGASRRPSRPTRR